MPSVTVADDRPRHRSETEGWKRVDAERVRVLFPVEQVQQ